MVSKRTVLMGALLVMVLLISSEVADARELTKTPNKVASKGAEKRNEHIVEIKAPSYTCKFGCCGSRNIPRQGYCNCCAYSTP